MAAGAECDLTGARGRLLDIIGVDEAFSRGVLAAIGGDILDGTRSVGLDGPPFGAEGVGGCADVRGSRLYCGWDKGVSGNENEGPAGGEMVSMHVLASLMLSVEGRSLNTLGSSMGPTSYGSRESTCLAFGVKKVEDTDAELGYFS